MVTWTSTCIESLGIALRTDVCLEEIGLHAQRLLTILEDCMVKMEWKPNSELMK